LCKTYTQSWNKGANATNIHNQRRNGKIATSYRQPRRVTQFEKIINTAETERNNSYKNNTQQGRTSCTIHTHSHRRMEQPLPRKKWNT
jgi:hypothetical protein